MAKNRILVIVDGGNVQDIICDKDTDIRVIDWDNIKEGGGYVDFDIETRYPITVDSKAVNKVLKETQEEVDQLKKDMEDEGE